MAFKTVLELTLGIVLTKEQEDQFDLYYRTLMTWNEKMNLTAITDRDEVDIKHFIDSISLVKAVDFTSKAYSICDVGAGAGFPSIPLKIMYPHLKVTIIDAQGKRITFLKHLIDTLKLNDVSLFHERAEIHAMQHREMYDLVTARAVAKMSMLSELCLPLVKVEGLMLAMKGPDSEHEVFDAKAGIEKLGGSTQETIRFSLPFDAGLRHIVVCKKVRKTPKTYPRSFAMIKSKPL